MTKIEKTITPVIKRTRVTTSRYEVCPHCKQEIHEKGYFMDDEYYVYHRGCVEKGPIDKIIPSPVVWDVKGVRKAAGSKHGGYLEKNIAGKDYIIEWTVELGQEGEQNQVSLTQPDNMPSDLWSQVKDGLQAEAVRSAEKAKAMTEMQKANLSGEDGAFQDIKTAKTITWLDRCLAKQAQNYVGLSNLFVAVPDKYLFRPGLEWVTIRFEDNELTLAYKATVFNDPVVKDMGQVERTGNAIDNIIRFLQIPSLTPTADGRLMQEEFKNWLMENVMKPVEQKNPETAAPKATNDSPRATDDDLAALQAMNEEVNITASSSSKTVVEAKTKPSKTPIQMPQGKPVDDKLLTDGLGAFMDVFVNYHSGPEGDTLSKWIIAVCQDPKFAKVAPLLQQFHALTGQIYKGIVDIAKQDNEIVEKVASLLESKMTKTAQAPAPVTPTKVANLFESCSIMLVNWHKKIKQIGKPWELEQVWIIKTVQTVMRDLKEEFE